jgi:hypothetical protein
MAGMFQADAEKDDKASVRRTRAISDTLPAMP